MPHPGILVGRSSVCQQCAIPSTRCACVVRSLEAFTPCGTALHLNKRDSLLPASLLLSAFCLGWHDGGSGLIGEIDWVGCFRNFGMAMLTLTPTPLGWERTTFHIMGRLACSGGDGLNGDMVRR